MNRRETITLLGGAAAWPLAVRAQQGGRMRRIGVLLQGDETDPVAKTTVSAFIQALVGLGWIDGRNVQMDVRWLGGDANRIPTLAQELVSLQPDIILAGSTPLTVALQRETRTIPIVFATVGDPVASGLVERLNQPGGNITGFANYEAPLGGKWLELLSEIAPGLKRAAIMFNPDSGPYSITMPSFEKAAGSLKVEIITAPVHSDAEIETASPPFGASREAALSSWGVHSRSRIAGRSYWRRPKTTYRRSIRNLILLETAVCSPTEPTLVDTWRRAGTYADRILRGAKPGDLPVQLPVKYEMIVNRKTATALGLTVPLSILLRADEVIE
jgi:putative ABC transport system substrate-binding protein